MGSMEKAKAEGGRVEAERGVVVTGIIRGSDGAALLESLIQGPSGSEAA